MSNSYDINLFVIQSILIIILFGIVLWLVKLSRITRLERRFSKYSVNVIENKEIALFDKLIRLYTKLRKNISKFLYKLKIFDEYSLKYEKYCDNASVIREDPMDYMSTKVLTGFAMMILIVISDVFQYKPITSFQLLTAFLIGFFIPDVLLISKEKMRKKQIEKDMLKAIIIMNNSFKSGLSIMQAIYMVSNELDGPISEEFKKMYIDLSFGLNMEVVFERFTKRIDTKEARYITTSLNVLNKTGGNIVQVFASVERNSFTRKKLEEELGALAASSSAIFKILVVIPVLLFATVFALNPAYLIPLFLNPVGWFLLTLMLLIYIVYIIVIRKVMKVKVML
ncbi:MAG: type II secretion system F family protein [Bacilli bacterium]|nr:type II secretion system F family protein [Bacilli bacterium]